MSAYMVDKEHIVYMVEAAISHALARGDGGRIGWRGISGAPRSENYCELRCMAGGEDKAKVGNMLWRANEESIQARYPDCKGPADYPGNGRDAATGYTLTGSDFGRLPANIEPVQVLKACNAFRYQACEHAGWEASEARSFIDSLRDKAISCLKGYDAAEWGAPKDTPAMGSAVAFPVMGSALSAPAVGSAGIVPDVSDSVRLMRHFCQNTKTGAKARCTYSRAGLNTLGDAVAVYAKGYNDDLAAVFGAAENNSDIMTDYFEKDRVRILPASPLFARACEMADAGRSGYVGRVYVAVAK